MSTYRETIARITPRNEAIEKTIRDTWEKIIPYGSYGKLVDMVAQYGAATDQVAPKDTNPCMIIAAADHGVAKLGLSAYPQAVTVDMAKNYLIPKGAGANALANYCGASIEVIDVGIAADMSDVPGMRHKKVMMGTNNMLEEPAMSEAQAIEAIEVGIDFVKEQVAKGKNVFLVGEMGIGNTTSSAIITAKFAGITAEEATGRGTNISDERLKLKQQVVHDVLKKYEHISSSDGLGILHSMGGLEFACLVGVMLGAAANKALVIIDGFNTTACALIAHAIAPASMDYVMASHLSSEKGHIHSLETLGLEAYIDLGFALGEATGGAIQMEMLDLAIAMYDEMKGAKA